MIRRGLRGQVVYLHVVELASFGVGYEALEDVLILDINNREGHTCLFDDVWESITWDRLGLLTLFDSITYRLNNVQLTTATQSYRGADAEGAAAASAAALARPWRASMGALRVDLGNVSSDSSSDEGAVLGTMPYVAYLCGCMR